MNNNPNPNPGIIVILNYGNFPVGLEFSVEEGHCPQSPWSQEFAIQEEKTEWAIGSLRLITNLLLDILLHRSQNRTLT